jgi:hypothetical protein
MSVYTDMLRAEAIALAGPPKPKLTPEQAFWLEPPIVTELKPEPVNPETIRRLWLPWIRDWYGDEKYYEMEGCHKHGGTWECPEGERHRFPRACSLTTCPIHGPRKLKKFWMKRLKNMRGPLILAEWRPAREAKDFADIRDQGEKWRRGKLEGGAHWVRYERRDRVLVPVMLFVLQEGARMPEGLTIIGDGETSEGALRWLQQHYLEELALAESAEEMAMIIDAMHRLQPFGPDRQRWAEQADEYHQNMHGEVSPKADNTTFYTEEDGKDSMVRKSTSPPARQPVKCPIHGVPMNYLGMVGPLSEFTYDPKYDTWVQYRE